MTSAQQRTAAVAPEAGYSRPRLVEPDGLSVSVRTEDGDTKMFDFSSVDAPPGLSGPLVAAFARVSGPTGTWRQMATVQNGWKALRRFLVFAGEEHPDVTTITGLTVDVWKNWRESTASASGRNGSSRVLRTLLREAEGLPARTRMALNGRIEENVERQTDAYKRDEMARIVIAARRVFRAAEARIGANREALERYRAEMEPADCVRVRFRDREWSHGEVLDHLSRTGRMPDSFKGVPRKRTGALREALGIGEEGTWYRVSLFPAVHEVYAAMILLVHAKGLNRSVMARLKVSDIERLPGFKPGRWIYQVDADKPRRGSDRYSPITFSGPAARLLQRTLAMGEPARDTLAGLGFAGDPLLVACQKSSYSRHESDLFITDWMSADGAATAWHERVQVCGADGEPIRVSLRRMRLSVQVLRGEASENSVDVSVRVYRGPDPQTHEQARPVVVQGLNDAVTDAKRRVAARVSESDAEAARADPAPLAARLGVGEEDVKALLEGRLDTATAACLDIMHSPHEVDEAGPCTASFLACVECSNAVATPDHIPRIVATREALVVAARSSPAAVRERHYTRHVAAFDDLLRQVPEPEVRRARAAVTPADIEAVAQLLNRSLDI